MNAETINMAAVIVLGLVAVVTIVAHAYARRKGDETLVAALAPYQAIAETLAQRLDTALAQYGANGWIGNRRWLGADQPTGTAGRVE